jgi:hypothetical protein
MRHNSHKLYIIYAQKFLLYNWDLHIILEFHNHDILINTNK